MTDGIFYMFKNKRDVRFINCKGNFPIRLLEDKSNDSRFVYHMNLEGD